MRYQALSIPLAMLIAFPGVIMAKKPLKQYYERRDLAQSGEPKAASGKKTAKKAIFVVQRHDASHLHYDFRIEIDGVLASWAVPKGPSLNPRVKRLAIQTEDHPLAYARFHGTIPAGNYGAGTVEIWDSGTYENIKEVDGKLIPMKECLQKGTIEIELFGKKLHGRFALIATHMAGKKSWLLIKMKDTKKQTKKTKQEKKKRTPKTAEEDPAIRVGSHMVNITHPDKPVSHKPPLIKQDLIDYYRAIAPTMLGYLKDRPIVMQRFVDGIDQEGFYQKEAADYFPAYIKRARLKKEDGTVNYVLINNPETLVYLANQGVFVFHAWLSTAKKSKNPDRIIFDLDPSDNDFSKVRFAALTLKKLLEALGLKSYVMTTGSRGLHVLIPIKPRYTFTTTRTFAHTVAQALVDAYPELFTLEVRKEKRGKKLFIDYLRNSYGATGVAPYSVRARPGAPVATPLDWKEVASKRLKPDQWNIKTIFKRLAQKKDPWRTVLSKKSAQSLDAAQKKLKTMMNNKE